MAEITQADYTAWKTSTFGQPFDIWHDGLPIEAVTSLSGDLRSQAVRMLIFGVQDRDGDAATALEAMGETSALPHLRTALSAASPRNKISFHQAISHLSRDEEDSSAMAEELTRILEEQNLHWGVRIDAAIGLAAFKDRESEEALLRAIEIPNDYLVKYHSCESLLKRWGITPKNILSHPAIFDLIRDVRKVDSIQDEVERGRQAVRLLNDLKE